MYDDPKVFNLNLRVRAYELDVHSNVKPSVYFNYLEETATQASDSWGYTYAWYLAAQRFWVARRQTLRFYAPITYGMDLRMYTWISEIRRVQSSREYDLRRTADGARVLRARTNWVFIDADTFRPERVPEEFMVAVVNNGSHEEDLDTAVREPVTIENPRIFYEARRVSYHELDPVAIVNNSVYVAWAESALTNALTSVGWDAKRLRIDEAQMLPLAHEVDYYRSAREHDPIVLTVRLAEVGGTRAAWEIEIRHADTNELLCKDRCVKSFVDGTGTRSIPDELLLALRD